MGGDSEKGSPAERPLDQTASGELLQPAMQEPQDPRPVLWTVGCAYDKRADMLWENKPCRDAEQVMTAVSDALSRDSTEIKVRDYVFIRSRPRDFSLDYDTRTAVMLALMRALLRIQQMASATSLPRDPTAADCLDQMDAIFGIALNAIRDYPMGAPVGSSAPLNTGSMNTTSSISSPPPSSKERA